MLFVVSLKHLGLGALLDPAAGRPGGPGEGAGTGTGAGSVLVTLPVLLSHPVQPLLPACEIRLFSEGFLIERAGLCRLPVLVSIGEHVERVWVADSGDVALQALALLPRPDPDLRPPVPPQGLIIVFQLKEMDKNGGGGSGLLPYAPFSPLLLSEEGGSGCRFVSLVVEAAGRGAPLLQRATAAWRVALRRHDLLEHRGTHDVRLPDTVLHSYLTYLDSLRTGGLADIEEPDGQTPAALLSSVRVSQSPLSLYPGAAPLSIRSGLLHDSS